MASFYSGGEADTFPTSRATATKTSAASDTATKKSTASSLISPFDTATKSTASSLISPFDTAMVPVPPSSELALTEEYPPVKFSTFSDLKEAVDSQYNKMSNGDGNQYLPFSHVTPKQFETIEARRVELSRGAAFTYFGDIETLIVKLPSEAHERGHGSLGFRIAFMLARMQLRPEEYCYRSYDVQGPEKHLLEGRRFCLQECAYHVGYRRLAIFGYRG
jgi:hypothetical protein